MSWRRKILTWQENRRVCCGHFLCECRLPSQRQLTPLTRSLRTSVHACCVWSEQCQCNMLAGDPGAGHALHACCNAWQARMTGACMQGPPAATDAKPYNPQAPPQQQPQHMHGWYPRGPPGMFMNAAWGPPHYQMQHMPHGMHVAPINGYHGHIDASAAGQQW